MMGYIYVNRGQLSKVLLLHILGDVVVIMRTCGLASRSRQMRMEARVSPRHRHVFVMAEMLCHTMCAHTAVWHTFHFIEYVEPSYSGRPLH